MNDFIRLRHIVNNEVNSVKKIKRKKRFYSDIVYDSYVESAGKELLRYVTNNSRLPVNIAIEEFIRCTNEISLLNNNLYMFSVAHDFAEHIYDTYNYSC